jgi:hypothetical protein
MNSENKNSSVGGMGCLGFLSVLLGVAFIVLKLVGVINWSWVWVLAPIWIYAALTLLIIIAVLILVILASKD